MDRCGTYLFICVRQQSHVDLDMGHDCEEVGGMLSSGGTTEEAWSMRRPILPGLAYSHKRTKIRRRNESALLKEPLQK
jgi:hypothetical protein